MNVDENFVFMNEIIRASVEVTQIGTIQYQYNIRTLVYQHDKVKLYHYQSRVKKPHTVPMLVVFATVNRPEILDLIPERSFIRGLLDKGMDVYLLDWGYPDKNDKQITIGDYVLKYLHNCVQFIQQTTHKEKINLLGICQGGTICLSYAVLQKNINKLILISSPIDFHTEDNVIGNIFRKLDVKSFVNVMGNIPGAWLTNFFISLRPFELVGKKYLHFLDYLEQPEKKDIFLRVEKWLYDAPDQTGASFTELIEECYQKNKLIKGEFCLNGKRVDLKKLIIPVLNIMASDDEIVPVSASEVLKKHVGTKNYSEKYYPSGHIGIYISDKVGKSMSQDIAEWTR